MAQDACVGVADAATRPVSRVAELQNVFLGLDSLYLVLEYPHQDVFSFWSAIVKDLDNPRLFEGIPFEDFLIRRGAHGYKLSVWDGDARLFMTGRVEDVLQDTTSAGQGMGVMLQLGPKWLVQYGNILSARQFQQNIFAQLAVFGMQSPDNYPARINRMDVTLDVLGLKVSDLRIDEWRDQWVGYAHQKHFYDSPSGKLEGFAIGSSKGAVRFKVYDKVAESQARNTLRFWRSVWGISEDAADIDVARFEWTVRAYMGKFAGLRYLSNFSFDRFMDVLNYVSLRWGRLCLPTDSNKTRRELAPLWLEVRRMIEAWTFDYDGMTSRNYDFRPDLTLAALKSVAGRFAALMARSGIELGRDEPVTIAEALKLLQESGLSLPDKAQEKWDVFSKLIGGRSDDE